eukprot:67549_1
MFVLLFALFLIFGNSCEVLIFGAGMTGIAAGHVLSAADIHEWVSYPPFINGTNGINGGVIPDDLVTAQYALWDTAQLCLWPLIDLILIGLKEDESYYDGLRQCLWREPLNLIQKTIQWDEFNLEFAINIHNYSLANSELDSYYLYGNQDLFITDPRGYQGITLNYAWEYLNKNNLNDDTRIELNSPVTLIEYDTNGGVTATVTKQDGTIKKYHAKYGLVTFSIGVLKGKHEEIIKFSPPLPSWKQDVINLNYMADYSAVYIEWSNDWWKNEHPEIDTSNIDVMVDDTYGYFPWFLNLNHPSLIPNSYIWRFDITEETAVKFQKQSVDETIKQLKNDKFSKYWDINNIPDPLNVIVGNNTINPYIQGAYSAYPVGFDWYGTVNALQYSVDQVLYFGGEHTNPDDSGFVHTAFIEGNRGANMILNCLGFPSGGFQCQGPWNKNQQNNITKLLKEKKIRKNKMRKSTI